MENGVTNPRLRISDGTCFFSVLSTPQEVEKEFFYPILQWDLIAMCILMAVNHLQVKLFLDCPSLKSINCPDVHVYYKRCVLKGNTTQKEFACVQHKMLNKICKLYNSLVFLPVQNYFS